MKPLKQLLSHQSLSKYEEQELVAQAQQGDPDAREQLVLSNMRYIYSVCRQYENDYYTAKDLVSYGVEGIYKAIDKYEDMGCRFMTYAGYWVRKLVRQAAIYNKLIRIPHFTGERLERISMCLSEYASEGVMHPKDSQIAARTGLSVQQVSVYRQWVNVNDIYSLDRRASVDAEHDDVMFLDFVSDTRQDLWKFATRIDLNYFLRQLTQRQRFVLTRSYGIPVHVSIRKMAKMFQISQRQIMKIRDEALAYCQELAEAML